MGNLQTSYLGMKLRSPLVASSSALSDNIDNVIRMAGAGASAIVLNSLYEEQVDIKQEALLQYLDMADDDTGPYAGLAKADNFYFQVDQYLMHIESCRKEVDVPIIASLNGASLGGWTRFAKDLEEAGANAIELNIYAIPTDFDRSSLQIENEAVEIAKSVKQAVTIPVAVKLSPFYTNMAYMAKRLDEAGADGLVLFNRFYQPDINLVTLEPQSKIQLSSSFDLRLPLRWIGILHGHIKADLAATSGIHSAEDVLKVILAGANVAMMTSAIIKRGIEYFREVEIDLRQWLDVHQYDSLDALRGIASHRLTDQPSVFERAQYIRGLKTYST